jgi:regulator of vacuolar morphogenesis
MFPEKSMFNFKEKLLLERKKALENYLQVISASPDTIWRRSKAWHEFLQLPETSHNLNPKTQTIDSSKWMQEYTHLLGYFTDIRTFLNENDRLTQKGNTSGAQSSKFQARKGLKNIAEKWEILNSSLETPQNISVGELARRKDLCLNSKLEIKSLEDLANAPTTSENTKVTKARLELLGDNRDGRPRSTRNFGVIVPVETEKTRALDDHGVLQLQNEQMQQQDDVIGALAQVVKRQKEIGLAIGNELDTQNHMLNQITDSVDKVDGGLKTADKKMNRIIKG